MRYLFVVLALVFCYPHLNYAIAADLVQRSKGYTGGCDEPTLRQDGTPFDCSTECEKIIYIVTTVEGDESTKVYTNELLSGCQDFPVDTRQWERGTYYRHAKAIDKNGLDSGWSPGNPFELQLAPPWWPNPR